jgi:hypothetical protein
VESVENRNWFGRNWKWAAPTGCLVLVLLVGAFIASIFYFVFSMMKTSETYQHALQSARGDAEVVAALGEPITEGWFVSGNWEENGASGQANFAIPVSGPKGGGTVYVEARKSAGQWHYATMVVEVDGSGERIDLLDQAMPALEPTQEPETPPAQ